MLCKTEYALIPAWLLGLTSIYHCPPGTLTSFLFFRNSKPVPTSVFLPCVQHPNSGILVMALFFIQLRMSPSLTTQQQGAFPQSTCSHHCWFILSLNTIWNYLIHFFVCFYGQEMGPSYFSLTLQLLGSTPFPIPRAFLSLVFYHSPASRLCFEVDLI